MSFRQLLVLFITIDSSVAGLKPIYKSDVISIELYTQNMKLMYFVDITQVQYK